MTKDSGFFSAPKVKHGNVYLGIVDWYCVKFDKNVSAGSLVIQMGSRRDSFFKTFRFTDEDIKRPKNFEENIPNLESGDAVLFTAHIDDLGCMARNIQYMGQMSDPSLKRIWENQLHEFDDDDEEDWPNLWGKYHHHHLPKTVKLKLRYRPKEKY